jgi:Lhr-like helicase
MTAPFDLLHPVVQHHVVNTLEWPDLRPLQQEAVAPVLAGVDCLLLAPTAGGKTEAAVLPLLSRMAVERWTGTSVLYVCPLRALLNNLQPRLDGYAGWLGRSARYWHGDVGQAARRQTLLMRPDILLTTPESLESILISTTRLPTLPHRCPRRRRRRGPRVRRRRPWLAPAARSGAHRGDRRSGGPAHRAVGNRRQSR